MSEMTASKMWRRNLIVTAFAELVAVIGFTVVIPLLPFFIQELGVQGEREVRLWSGVVLSAHAVTMAVFGPIWGALGDRYGRKVMVERAMFSGAALIGLMALSQNAWQLVLLRALQGALTGSVTAATALVATTVPRERVGHALGVLQVGVWTGASAGPLLGGVLCDSFGYQTTFWVTGGLLFLAALGVALFIEERFEPGVSVERTAVTDARRPGLPRRAWNRLVPVLSSSALLGVLGIRLLMRSGARLLGPVLPLFVQEMMPSEARVASVTGLISGVSAGAGALGALWLGRLGDRAGYQRTVVLCALISAVCYVPQYFVSDPLWLLPLQLGTGLAMGGILTAVSASLARLAPEGREGLVYGLEATVVSVANVIGPMTGSVLMAWLGLRLPFLVAAGIFGLAGLMAGWLPLSRSPDAECFIV